MELAIQTVSPPSIKILSTERLIPIRHFFIQLLTPYSLLSYHLHLCDLSHIFYIYKPLLNALYMSDSLLIEDPVVLVLQRVNYVERFFFANKPSSEFMPMIVIGMQNLFRDPGQITHQFGLLGYQVIIYKQISITSRSNAFFQSQIFQTYKKRPQN